MTQSRKSDQFAGIEIGGTKIQVVLGDGDGRIARRWRGAVDKSRGGEGIVRQIDGMLAELRQVAEPMGIGVGFGGPVNVMRGVIIRSHQIEGWDGFEIRRWLERQSSAPVVIENDANVAAFAEATAGADSGVAGNPFFYVTLGSGVGGGLIVDGKIYHGALPAEMEFGHLRLGRDGATVEQRCSGWAVDARIRELTAHEPAGALAALCGNSTGGEAKYLTAAIEAGDALAETLLSEVADEIAFALSHVVHLVHPQVIALGGGLSLIGEPLRMRVERHLPGYVMRAMQPPPLVKIAALVEDVVPVGALRLAALAARS